MIHVIVEIKMHLVQLLFHLKLHHTDARARVGAGTTNNLKHMLISFPIRLNFVGAQEIFNSVKMINSEFNSFVYLLTVQVHHFIDNFLPIQVSKNLILSFFLFDLILFLKAFKLRDLFLNLLLRFLSIRIKKI